MLSDLADWTALKLLQDLMKLGLTLDRVRENVD